MPPKRKNRKRHRKRKNKSEAGTSGDSSEEEHSASQKSRQSEDEPLGSSQDNAAGQSDLESVASQLPSLSLQGAVGPALLPEAKDHGAPTTLHHPHMVFWQDTVQKWYPHYDKQTYFLPSVFMNRMQLGEKQAAGQNVLVINPPVTQANVPGAVQDKDVREDKAHQKVLDCIQLLQEQAMFVISQLEFGNYLGEPAYAAAAKRFPRPLDPPLVSQNKDQGDFDILIIHKDFGILAGEIKSVGDNFSALKMSEKEQDSKLIKRVKEAIKQMKKSRDVLTYIVPKHHNQQPRIKTTLILPNIAKAQLRRALSACDDTKTALCQSLGLNDSEDPIPLCLTEDDLQNPTNWWNCIMTREGKDPVLESSDSMYLDLISRFCGPATTITVHCPSTPRLAIGSRSSLRSPGNGVAETARRFAPADIMLHPTQVDLLNAMQPCVYIAGPPGTGKSVVLLVKAKDWLKQGKTVLLVSTQPEAFGASYMIEAQLEQSQETQGQIQLLSIDLTTGDYTDALLKLQNRVENGELYIIADEVFTGSAFRDLCRDLKQTVPGLHFWAASLNHEKGPGCLTEVILTEPLRTPPRVTREINNSGFTTQDRVKHYTIPRGPLPTDGPAVISLLHEGEGHGRGTTYDCRQCGKDIAKKLIELGVGQAGSAEDPWSYQHVFILTKGQDLVDMKQNLKDMEQKLVDVEKDLVDQNQKLVNQKQVLVDMEQDLVDQEQKLVDQKQVFVDMEQDLVSQKQDLVDQKQDLVKKKQDLLDQEQVLVDMEQDLVDQKQDLVKKKQDLMDQKQDLVKKKQDLVDQKQDLEDQKQDLVDMGAGTSAAAPRHRRLLLGLKELNIPYRVLLEGDSDGIKQVATMSGPNEVIVSQSKIVSGLERPVVVWVQRDQASQDENIGRLHAMSRTTAQLIWVRCPP